MLSFIKFGDFYLNVYGVFFRNLIGNFWKCYFCFIFSFSFRLVKIWLFDMEELELFKGMEGGNCFFEKEDVIIDKINVVRSIFVVGFLKGIIVNELVIYF